MANEYCGIMIGPDDFHAVALRSARKGLKLTVTGLSELKPEEREDPGPALKAFIKKNRKLPTKATLCLPKDQVTLQNVTLPTSDSDEVKGMLRFEAERHIPFNADRHELGYHLMRDLGEEGSEVLMAAADGPIVQRVTQAAQHAGLRPGGLNVSAACLVNALLHTHPDMAKTKTIALISIGLKKLDLVFLTEGRLVFSRTIPHGLLALLGAGGPKGLEAEVKINRARLANAARMIDMMNLDQHPAETAQGATSAPGSAPSAEAAREWVQRLIQEVRRSYDFARRQMNCPEIDGLVLTGEGAIVRNLDKFLTANMNLQTVVLNPLAPLMKTGKAKGKKKDNGLPFGGLELTVAFGAAIQDLEPNGYRIDLTPESNYRRVRRGRLMRNLAVAGVFGLVTLGLGAASVLEWRDQRERMIRDYRGAINQFREPAAKLREEKKKLAILEAFLDDPTSGLAVLHSVSSYPGCPENVSIQSIAYTKGDNVMIGGHAATIPDLINFVEYLRQSELFENVDPKEQQLKRPLRNREQVYVFRVQCTIGEYRPSARRRDVASRTQSADSAGEGGAGEAGRAERGAPRGGADPSAPAATTARDRRSAGATGAARPVSETNLSPSVRPLGETNL